LVKKKKRSLFRDRLRSTSGPTEVRKEDGEEKAGEVAKARSCGLQWQKQELVAYAWSSKGPWKALTVRGMIWSWGLNLEPCPD
jgi:hypothetical protein